MSSKLFNCLTKNQIILISGVYGDLNKIQTEKDIAKVRNLFSLIENTKNCRLQRIFQNLLSKKIDFEHVVELIKICKLYKVEYFYDLVDKLLVILQTNLYEKYNLSGEYSILGLNKLRKDEKLNLYETEIIAIMLNKCKMVVEMFINSRV